MTLVDDIMTSSLLKTSFLEFENDLTGFPDKCPME